MQLVEKRKYRKPIMETSEWTIVTFSSCLSVIRNGITFNNELYCGSGSYLCLIICAYIIARRQGIYKP